MANEPKLKKLSYPVMEYDDRIEIAFQKGDYEFVGISPEGNIKFKLHKAVLPEQYAATKAAVAEFNEKYGNLTKDVKRHSSGVDINTLFDMLVKRWFAKKHISKSNFVDAYKEQLASGTAACLAYEPNDYFKTCRLERIYITEGGELYIDVVYRNNGISLFGTLNSQEKTFNLRDVSDPEWFAGINRIMEKISGFVCSTGYDDKFSA